MIDKKGSDTRVNLQPAFVLHTYPWRETSLIVELFSRDFGRLSLVARGAKRPMSQYRGMLNPFCPLSVSFAGKGEIKNLFKCEWHGTLHLSDKVLMSGFYINELIVRLLARLDPFPNLFSSYFNTLRALAEGQDQRVVLRHFELDLLKELGYGLPEGPFHAPFYRFSNGDFIAQEQIDDSNPVSLDTLLAMKARTIQPGKQEQEARQLTRELIGYYLEDRPLNTRNILNELKKL